MARAHRHYIPGQIWHITHRCHKRDFLLKYVKDRHRWLQWLFEAKKRYGLVILNYTVTSNHIHLLVYDDNAQGVIPKSMQLIAGRIGQEYNQRKKRCQSIGRRVRPSGDGFELRETVRSYNAHFDAEKCDIDADNTWFWDFNQ